MSNSLDPDQAPHFVGPDVGPSYLHKLSADDTSRYRVNINPNTKIQIRNNFKHRILFIDLSISVTIVEMVLLNTHKVCLVEK